MAGMYRTTRRMGRPNHAEKKRDDGSGENDPNEKGKTRPLEGKGVLVRPTLWMDK